MFRNYMEVSSSNLIHKQSNMTCDASRWDSSGKVRS